MSNDLSLRDFDPDMSLKDAWNSEKYLYFISESVHVSLNPSRWAFYDKFKNSLSTIKEKRIALSLAFEVLSQELNNINNLSADEVGSRAFRSEIIDALNNKISSAFKALP